MYTVRVKEDNMIDGACFCAWKFIQAYRDVPKT
jgi:hypothetical protein